MKTTEFKVGDWVITEFTIDKIRGIKKIIALAEDGWDTFQNEDCSIEAAPYTIVELWAPKLGEFCWFWDDNNYPERTLSQFEVKIDETFYSLLTSWKYCEPFIGVLPSFLKEL